MSPVLAVVDEELVIKPLKVTRLTIVIDPVTEAPLALVTVYQKPSWPAKLEFGVYVIVLLPLIDATPFRGEVI